MFAMKPAPPTAWLPRIRLPRGPVPIYAGTALGYFAGLVRDTDDNHGLSSGRRGDSAMARTYRDIAIEQMLGTVEQAMNQVIDYWPDLPQPMEDAVGQFRTRLGAAIDSVEFVKRALDREVHETDRGKGPA
jgi:hypothetical protein